MKFVTFVGPPSSGKTSVILKTMEHIKKLDYKVGAIKFDCLSSTDDKRYEKSGIPVSIGLAGRLCPDHFFITYVEDCIEWGHEQNLDLLVSESAGLCNRCSPHVRNVLAICVVDNLAGVSTPKKIGPMLRFADIVVVTKGDIVSQAEREVFRYHIKKANPLAEIISVNGITGQGSYILARRLLQENETNTLVDSFLRFSMPSALCSYCIGQTKITAESESVNQGLMRFGGNKNG